MITAARFGSNECVRLLIDAGVNVDGDYGSQALLGAVQLGSVECVNMLLQAGVDVNAGKVKYSPLYHTALGGRDHCVEVLIKAGAVIDEGLLKYAVQSNSPRVVDLLLTAGAVIDEMTLDAAAEIGSIKVVSLLLEAGVSAETMLPYAIHERRKGIVEMLIKAGLNVNTSQGSNALVSAAELRTVECVKLLLDAGADVNGVNDDGRTVLLEAVYNNSVECAEVLLETGADVNDIDDDGNTVLFDTSPSWFSDRRLNCYKLLLCEPVKVNVTNNHGFNALTDYLKNIDDLLYY